MGSRRALYGALRVNVLIHRGLREKAELGPLTPMHAASKFVRALSGVFPVVDGGSKGYSRDKLRARFAMEYDHDNGRVW